MVGALAGGYLTEGGHANWCFMLRAILGLLIAFTALTLTKAVESDAEERIKASSIQRIKTNSSDIYRAFLKTPPLYKSLAFFVM